MTENVKQFEVLNEGDQGYPPYPETQVQKNHRFIWDSLRQPPKEALKPIKAGRLKGKTDINPQWRYEAVIEQFGPCGIGWKYEIKRLWTEPGPDGQVFAFAEVYVYYKKDGTDGPIPDDVWSDPIPGIGGSMLVAKESAGLHSNDEGYKMAVTDALSVALKMIGVAADIYMGRWDGTEFWEKPEVINDQSYADLKSLISEVGANEAAFLKYLKIDSLKTMPASMYETAMDALEMKRK